MSKAYLAIGLHQRSQSDTLVQNIRDILSEAGIRLFVFVDQYRFLPEQESEMMQTAFREIEASDILIAELSEKAIGVGVEAGYAFARGKQIWYLRQKQASHSTTVAGIAHHQLIYQNIDDLLLQMAAILKKNR